ncbi:MAG: saccharopine dehydrogenase NADP-binding domain-containing protein [Bacteroidetes bacterium]|nr:saccharopine dehydrogenase NADP-binding domain-containing protein [Bacteroidota bacterium]
MKHILVLGAGQSTSYLISYLLQHAEQFDWFVTVGDHNAELATQRVAGHPRGQALQFDINDEPTRVALLKKAKIVVNMLPRPYQHLVALECLKNSSHMITASYEDPMVRKLETEAHRKNILILNEMGLDPGIDHMVGMALIQRIRNQGGVVNSFRSYGGGLPAPKAAPNPLNYAITWNPRNVLMAGEDGALYKEDGRINLLPFHQLFQRTWTVDVEGIGTLEAYPNRDSLAYESVLGLTMDHTIIRGTLRYPGWSETWQQIVYLGLANEALRIPNLKNMTYRELTEMALPQSQGPKKLEQQVANYLGISPTGKIMDNLKWLGLFSKEKIGVDVQTVAEVMIHLMKQKLRMPDGAQDMVVLVHEIECHYPNENNRKEQVTSTFIEYGEPGGHTAISKTVGMPAAIATKLVLTDRLPLTGCHIPTHPAVYEPVLKELVECGLVFKESAKVLE